MTKARSGRVVLGSGKFLRLVRDGRYEFAERTNARGCAAVIAVTDQRELVLTEQFRPPVGRTVIDLPAGLTGDVPGDQDEESAQSALRELIEETGYSAASLHACGICPTSPGLTSEIMSYFLATGVKRVQAGGGVGHEQILVQTPPLRTIRKWLSRQVAAGKLIDPKVYVGLYLWGARSRR